MTRAGIIGIMIGMAFLLCLAVTVPAGDWSVAVPPPTCTTALGVAVACSDATAVNFVFAYTVRDDQGATVKTGTLTLPKTMSRQAIVNSLRYLGQQQRYAPPPPPDPTTGVTIPIQ